MKEAFPTLDSSSHVMPTLAFALAGICGCGFFCPFLLTGNDQRVKADIIGPNAQSGRFPAMSAGPARPPQSSFGVPTHYQPLTRQQTTTNDYSRLQTFVQRVGLDKQCIFAAETQKRCIMEAKQTDNKEIKDFVSVEERILKLVREASETDWENNRWVILGEPTPKEVKKLNALLGCDVTGFQRMIDISAVKHSRKKHPNMTETDFCLIPMIISAADEITKGKYPDTVVYRKTLEKEYYYVECTRTGRKRLAMKTFYKTKIGG